MGFYTDFSVDLTLRDDTPAEVVDLVRYMAWIDWETNPGPKRPDAATLPVHALFKCDRWDHMFATAPAASRKFDGTHLQIEGGSFKNYDNELREFQRWIRPHCVPQDEAIIESENEDNFQCRYYADGRAQRRKNPDYIERYHCFGQSYDDDEESPWRDF